MDEEKKVEEVVAEESEETVEESDQANVAPTVEVTEAPVAVEVEPESEPPVVNVDIDPTPIVEAINASTNTSTTATIAVGEDKLTVLHEVTTGDLLISTLIAANIIVALIAKIIK